MINELANEGKKKKIERALSVNCLICRQSINCPDEDFWAWLKSGAVQEFRNQHSGHAFAVGAQIRFVERE